MYEKHGERWTTFEKQDDSFIRCRYFLFLPVYYLDIFIQKLELTHGLCQNEKKNNNNNNNFELKMCFFE